MSTEKAEAAPFSQRLKMEIALEIKHTVYVTVKVDSTQTLEQMKDKALTAYKQAAGESWEKRFQRLQDIRVGIEEVTIGDLSVREARVW